MTPSEGEVLFILLVRDDWESCAQFLVHLGLVFEGCLEELPVLVVDDGSTQARWDWSGTDWRSVVSFVVAGDEKEFAASTG